MRYVWLSLLALGLSACSLSADYVRQDRANYEQIAPVVSKLLAETAIYDDEFEQDIRDRLNAWDAWSQAGMESLKDE